MTTNSETMTVEMPPADEAVRMKPEEGVSGPSRPVRRQGRRVASLVLGSVGLSLAATALAIRRANRRQARLGGRRRGIAVSIQPRVAVFAPTLTISLPFSGITGQTPTRGVRAVRVKRVAGHRTAEQRRRGRLWGVGKGRNGTVRRSWIRSRQPHKAASV